jgi:hypothetical protein
MIGNIGQYNQPNQMQPGAPNAPGGNAQTMAPYGNQMQPGVGGLYGSPLAPGGGGNAMNPTMPGGYGGLAGLTQSGPTGGLVAPNAGAPNKAYQLQQMQGAPNLNGQYMPLQNGPNQMHSSGLPNQPPQGVHPQLWNSVLQHLGNTNFGRQQGQQAPNAQGQQAPNAMGINNAIQAARPGMRSGGWSPLAGQGAMR